MILWNCDGCLNLAANIQNDCNGIIAGLQCVVELRGKEPCGCIGDAQNGARFPIALARDVAGRDVIGCIPACVAVEQYHGQFLEWRILDPDDMQVRHGYRRSVAIGDVHIQFRTEISQAP